MSEQTLSIRKEDAVMHVSINNPPVNLLSGAMVKEMFGLIGQLMFDPTTKVVVFESGVSDFFIAHFDLNDLVNSIEDPQAKSQFDDINILQSLALGLQSLPQVTIAKINGACRGGGLELVLGMSMRFASESSRFCAPEASGGFLACGGGSTRLMAACGPGRALEFLLSSRDFLGYEAQDYGIINRALPDDELDGYVDSLVQKLAQRSNHVIGIHKELTKRALSFAVEPMFDGFAYENEACRSSMDRSEFKEKLAAMLPLGQTPEIELDLPKSIELANVGIAVD